MLFSYLIACTETNLESSTSSLWFFVLKTFHWPIVQCLKSMGSAPSVCVATTSFVLSEEVSNLVHTLFVVIISSNFINIPCFRCLLSPSSHGKRVWLCNGDEIVHISNDYFCFSHVKVAFYRSDHKIGYIKAPEEIDVYFSGVIKFADPYWSVLVMSSVAQTYMKIIHNSCGSMVCIMWAANDATTGRTVHGPQVHTESHKEIHLPEELIFATKLLYTSGYRWFITPTRLQILKSIYFGP